MVVDYWNRLSSGDRFGKLNRWSGFSVRDHDYFVIFMLINFNIVVVLCIINGMPIMCGYITNNITFTVGRETNTPRHICHLIYNM